jgi:hypothetical protein
VNVHSLNFYQEFHQLRFYNNYKIVKIEKKKENKTNLLLIFTGLDFIMLLLIRYSHRLFAGIPENLSPSIDRSNRRLGLLH